MGLASGARLGPYEIIAAIGAGGMGEECFGEQRRANGERDHKLEDGSALFDR
jgi:hypothetical protein